MARDPTASEVDAFKVERSRLFKGSIAVCVVYGVIALCMLIFAAVNQSGREFMADNMMPFIVTFVVGTIIVIFFLVLQVATFKIHPSNATTYDGEMCPDYWTLQKSTDADIPSSVDENARGLMNFKCVPNPSVYRLDATWGGSSGTDLGVVGNNGVNVFGQVTNVETKDGKNVNTYYVKTDNTTKFPTTDKVANDLKAIDGMTFTAADGTKGVYCDRLFPALLASEDDKKYPDNKNSIRCKYAKVCGIPWTSVCP